MTPDRVLTASEIARTALPRVNPRKASPFGSTHPHRDANEMCVYCKREDTDEVTDAGYLAPFRAYYGERRFRVMCCPSCQAVFSFQA